jgi:Transcription initiation factor TFIIIB, Brf1 subunit/Transcription initiation factor TFIIB
LIKENIYVAETTRTWYEDTYLPSGLAAGGDVAGVVPMTDGQSLAGEGAGASGAGHGDVPERCPECTGRIISDEGNAEARCADCGLVVSEAQVDPGPEWRAFDAAERDEKSRVGSPTTPLMHDRGLTATIGWRDEDAYGRSLDARKRAQLSRLRTWDERYRTQDAGERNLKLALGEVDRMASALGLADPVRETASVIYRQALETGLLPGRSIEGMASASLYAAARIEGVARSVDEIAGVSRVESLEIERAYRYQVRELGLEIPPTNPLEYLGRFASRLDCRDTTERRARELIERAIQEGAHSGKHPVGIAASALYAAGRLTGEDLVQQDVADATEVSTVTIRNRYRELLAVVGED